MDSFFKTVDTVIMGRKTYDIALKLGQTSYPGKRNYVFSRSPRPSGHSNVEFVSENAGEFARRLRSLKGKDIWLVGGADLIASFLDAAQIDEFIIHIVPVMIGEGIPLIHPQHRLTPLKLLSCRAFSDGVVRLDYAVERQASVRVARNRSRKSKVES